MAGWVYIAMNEFMPDVVKVGRTDVDLGLRMSQISKGSGFPKRKSFDWASASYIEDNEAAGYLVNPEGWAAAELMHRLHKSRGGV